jgi:hypothetical protein
VNHGNPLICVFAVQTFFFEQPPIPDPFPRRGISANLVVDKSDKEPYNMLHGKSKIY